MNTNYIPPFTLDILFKDSRQEIIPEFDFEGWCGNLNFPLKYDYSIIPDFADTQKNEDYKFQYDKSRLDPYHINTNLNSALNLLDECYNLKDAYNELDVITADRIAAKEMFDQLSALEKEEIEILKLSNIQIKNATKINFNKDNEREFYNFDFKNDSKLLEKKISLFDKKNLIEKKERDRIYKEFNDPDSPYNLSIRSSRLKAIRAHKMTELAFNIECLKHGLYLVYGKEPERLKSPSINELQNFKNQFQTETLELLNDPIKKIKELVSKSQLELGNKNTKHSEIETNIRVFLWGVDKYLSRKDLIQIDYYDVISLKSIFKDQNSFKKGIESGKFEFNLDSTNYYDLRKINPDKTDKSREMILGINAELTFINTEDPKNLNKHIKFSFQIGNSRTIYFISRTTKVDNSIYFNGINSNAFFGGDYIINRSLNETMNLQFKIMDKVDLGTLFGKIEDLKLFIHIRRIENEK